MEPAIILGCVLALLPLYTNYYFQDREGAIELAGKFKFLAFYTAGIILCAIGVIITLVAFKYAMNLNILAFNGLLISFGIWCIYDGRIKK